MPELGARFAWRFNEAPLSSLNQLTQLGLDEKLKGMPGKKHSLLMNLTERTSRAVAHYWKTRATQIEKQKQTGKADQGLRRTVTGGAQMDGFINLWKQPCID